MRNFILASCTQFDWSVRHGLDGCDPAVSLTCYFRQKTCSTNPVLDIRLAMESSYGRAYENIHRLSQPSQNRPPDSASSGGVQPRRPSQQPNILKDGNMPSRHGAEIWRSASDEWSFPQTIESILKRSRKSLASRLSCRPKTNRSRSSRSRGGNHAAVRRILRLDDLRRQESNPRGFHCVRSGTHTDAIKNRQLLRSD